MSRHTMVLPPSCEQALLERFLKAEAMAMWSVRAAQASDVPAHVLKFLRRHESDERRHLQRFEALVGVTSLPRHRLPRVPRQWPALAVHLYGYEALGLELAKLLVSVRPDMVSILREEHGHVRFFEEELRAILHGDGPNAESARLAARSWWNKLPRTLARYLADERFAASREDLTRVIGGAIESRFVVLGLFTGV